MVFMIAYKYHIPSEDFHLEIGVGTQNTNSPNTKIL